MGHLSNRMDTCICSARTNQLQRVVRHVADCVFQMLLDRRRMDLPLPTTVRGTSVLDTYCVFSQYNLLDEW
jgi:hypothetical protein